MKRCCLLTVLAALSVWLGHAAPAQAQLFREWSHNIWEYGVNFGQLPIVDDSGNVYVLTSAGGAYTGARITKFRTDATVDWQADYLLSGLRLDFFGRSKTGNLYVVGHLETESFRTAVLAVKFDPFGNKAWDTTITPVASSYYVSDPRAAVDLDGNLWIGVTEPRVSIFCIDSLPDGSGNAGGTGEIHMAVIYRLQEQTGLVYEADRIDGGDRTPTILVQLVADGEGYIDARILYQEFCCNDNCQNCRDTCFYEYGSYHEGHAYYRDITYLHRYTSVGGHAGSFLLSSSDNEFYDAELRTGRNGELFIDKGHFTSVDSRGNTQWSLFGQWSAELLGGVFNSSPLVTDYSGNVLLGQATGNDYDPTQFIFIEGNTGSVRWAKPNMIGGGFYGCDREGNIFISNYDEGKMYKFDAWGNQLWSYSPGYGIYAFFNCDTLGYLYYTDSYVFSKYRDDKYLTIRDAQGDSIPGVEFELHRVANDPPVFTDALLGRFTTDDRGRLKLNSITADSFVVDLDPKPDTIALGDSLRILKHVYSKPAPRRSGSMYSIWLDNAHFAADGHMYYDSLTSANQDIVLDHTELRYNLNVVVMWMPSVTYQTHLMENLGNFSNFLYDVSDGQIRLDTVMIGVEGWGGSMADMKIMADNVEWPHCDNGVGGIYQMSHQQLRPIVMPRKWYGDTTYVRELSYVEGEFTSGALDVNTPDDYRTKVHEFGHYALAFYDEYLFWLPSMFGMWGGYTPDTGLGLRCLPQNIFNYGFMDNQYSSGGATANASEMSSKYRYEMADCRNTKQYRELGMSCWDYFENMIEPFTWWGPDGIYVPILKPDRDDPDERDSLSVNDIFIGPNDDMNNLDYDVGALIVFDPNIHLVPPGYSNKKITVSHPAGIDRVSVCLKNKLTSPLPSLPLEEGLTSDLGKIWVLGVYDPDFKLEVTKNNQAGRWHTKASMLASGVWQYGSLTSISGDSAEIALNDISGDYPIVVGARLASDKLTIELGAPNLLPETPSLEMQTADSGLFQYAMAGTGNGYTADIFDAFGSQGMLAVNAADDMAQPFAFDCSYSTGLLTSDSLNPRPTLSSEDGRGEVFFDTIGGTPEKGFLLDSPYPVPLSGLGPDALQVGKAYTLALYPDMALNGAGQLFVRYQDDNLRIDGLIAGDENSLAIFRWDTTGSQWVVLPSAVDTVSNIVSAVISASGTYAVFSTDIVSGVGENDHDEGLPYRFELGQNYPNPFNPTTTIEYTLPKRSRVVIDIYNIVGQKVRSLVDDDQAAGSYSITWDGTDASGQSLATGIYFYRLVAGDDTRTRKMLLLK